MCVTFACGCVFFLFVCCCFLPPFIEFFPQVAKTSCKSLLCSADPLPDFVSLKLMSDSYIYVHLELNGLKMVTLVNK